MYMPSKFQKYKF